MKRKEIRYSLWLNSLLIVFLLGQPSWGQGEKRTDSRLEIQTRQGKENLSELKTYIARSIPIDPWEAPKEGFRYEQTTSGVVVMTQTAKLVFSNRTANIVESAILGTPLGNIPYPNLVIKRFGKTFSQNNSRSGSLKIIDEGDFLVIKGQFLLTADDGEKSFSWQVTYRICKENGYTIVTYTNPTGEFQSGSYFSVEHKFNRIDRHGLDQLALGCGGIEKKENWWQSWSEHRMGEKDKVYTDRYMLNLVMMGNGRIGIASEPPSTMKIFNIADNQSGYLRVETVSGARSFAWIIVNQPTTSGVAVGATFPDKVEYTLCFYPLREYRTVKHMYFPSYWTTGLQMGYLGSDLTENLDAGNRHTREMNEDIRKYGGKVMFMAPNWEVSSDSSEQLHYFGKPIGWGGEDSRQQCWGSKRFQKRFFKDLMIEAVQREAGDGARLDCSTPNWCNNTAHGCDIEHSFHSLTLFDAMRQLRKDYDALQAKTDRQYLIGAAVSSYPSVNAFSDWVCSGEGNAGYPSQMACDLYFNSLFYGRDFTLLVGGNSPVNADSPRIYEQMLERCGTVTFHLYNPTSTHKHASMWKKYFNPLLIFGVKQSQVHHPYHYDYTQFVSRRDNELLNILYSRPGVALAALCNRNKQDREGPFEINLGALGIKKRKVLLFEVNTETTRVEEADHDGRLRTRIPYPEQYDVSFILVKAMPENPQVIWNSVTTRFVSDDFSDNFLSVNAEGLPGLESRLFVYCPQSSYPTTVEGGKLAAFNSVDRIGLIDFVFDEKGQANLKVKFKKGKPVNKEIDIKNKIELLRKIHAKIDVLNYTSIDADELKKLCMDIRNHAYLLTDGKERRRVLEEVNDAERLLFCQQKIIECPVRVRGLPKWNSRDKEITVDYVKQSGAVAMEWAVVGPFANKGFDKRYPPEKGLSFKAVYTGKNSERIAWKRVIGYYLDLGYAIRSPRLGAVGNPLRDMIGFARTTIVSPEDRKAMLHFKSEGSVQIRLNGKEIAVCKTTDNDVTISARKVEIELRKGRNVLMLKTESGGDNWLFYPVIKDSRGKVMQDLQFIVKAVPSSQNPYAHAFFLNVFKKTIILLKN